MQDILNKDFEIKKLNDELTLYSMNVEDDPEDHNSWYSKALTLGKLYMLYISNPEYNKDICNNILKDSLACYDKAISLFSTNPLYRIDRAKLFLI